MKHVTTESVQNDFDDIMSIVTRYNEPITIVSNDNRVAVLVSMEEWNNIQETLYLQSIPGMVESIKAAAAEPLSDGIDASDIGFDV